MSESENESNIYENFSCKALADNITTTRPVNHYQFENPTSRPENGITSENHRPVETVNYHASQQATVNLPLSSNNVPLSGGERSVPSATEYDATTTSSSQTDHGIHCV